MSSAIWNAARSFFVGQQNVARSETYGQAPDVPNADLAFAAEWRVPKTTLFVHRLDAILDQARNPPLAKVFQEACREDNEDNVIDNVSSRGNLKRFEPLYDIRAEEESHKYLLDLSLSDCGWGPREKGADVFVVITTVRKETEEPIPLEMEGFITEKELPFVLRLANTSAKKKGSLFSRQTRCFHFKGNASSPSNAIFSLHLESKSITFPSTSAPDWLDAVEAMGLSLKTDDMKALGLSVDTKKSVPESDADFQLYKSTVGLRPPMEGIFHCEGSDKAFRVMRSTCHARAVADLLKTSGTPPETDKEGARQLALKWRQAGFEMMDKCRNGWLPADMAYAQRRWELLDAENNGWEFLDAENINAEVNEQKGSRSTQHFKHLKAHGPRQQLMKRKGRRRQPIKATRGHGLPSTMLQPQTARMG